MKLFSLGRTDLAVSSKLPTPVGIANCRRTIIVLRTSVMVRYTWRSPWTVVFAHCVQSSNDNRCRRYFLNTFIHRYHVSNSPYHDITELLNISASVDFIHFLSFLDKHPPGSLFLPPNCTNYFQQSTRISKKWTTRPPTPFSCPPPLFTQNLINLDKKLHFWFLTEIQSLLTEKFRKLGRRVICRRDRLAKLCFTGKFEWSNSSNVQVMSKTKKSAKKR